MDIPDAKKQIADLIDRSLLEDIGDGDVTTEATIPKENQAVARFLAKADGIMAGTEVAEHVFHKVDSSLKVAWECKDGDAVTRGTYFGSVSGSARSIIIGQLHVHTIHAFGLYSHCI